MTPRGTTGQVLRRTAVGLAIVLVLLLGAGCADGTVGTDPIATVPEPDPPAVPTLGATPSPEPDGGAVPADATAGEEVGTPTTAPDAGAGEETGPTAQPPITTEQDPAALGRELGIAGLIALLEEDPDLAGRRGEDLREELEDIDERSGGSARKRIEDLQEDIDDWVDDGDLDAGVGAAARAALEQAAAQLSEDDRDDDDRDRDDDDDD